MERCDVVIVGGGPAGSSCARKLHEAGLGVIVLDRAVFPRDKVCAGWITPQAIDELELDCADYQIKLAARDTVADGPIVGGVDHVARTAHTRAESRNRAPGDAASWPAAPGVPELYFCRDLSGYGWCFRKGQHINIGFGLLGRRSLTKAMAEFVAFLRAQHRIPADAPRGWRGHAYLVADAHRRRATGDGVLLIGDAAGVAYPESGEGIRPAIESGLLAASTLIAAKRSCSRERLERYERTLRRRGGGQRGRRWLARAMMPALTATLLPRLLGTRWFTRHLVLDRWFLHAHDPTPTW